MRLSVIKTTPGVGLCATGPLLTRDGDRLDDYWLEPVSPFDLDYGIVFVDEVLALGDRLVSVAWDLIVSETARRVIERLAPPSYLSFLPTTVMSHEKEVLAEYYYALGQYEVDALDYDRSEFEYFHTQPDVPSAVKKWAFRIDKVPPFDLFRSKFRRWIGTQHAAKAIEGAQLTGFELECVWDSGDG